LVAGLAAVNDATPKAACQFEYKPTPMLLTFGFEDIPLFFGC